MPLAALLALVGIEVSAWRTDAPELMLLGIAFTMSVPMAAWMRYRIEAHGDPLAPDCSVSSVAIARHARGRP